MINTVIYFSCTEQFPTLLALVVDGSGQYLPKYSSPRHTVGLEEIDEVFDDEVLIRLVL